MLKHLWTIDVDEDVHVFNKFALQLIIIELSEVQLSSY